MRTIVLIQFIIMAIIFILVNLNAHKINKVNKRVDKVKKVLLLMGR